tara:strand:- start:2558 stop:3076 length:519 start_codon:yes stop_codon:yes gene_type:complete
MNYKIKLNYINTFIFDVDGVLTDGTVTLFGNGEQVRKMCTRDGYAIQYAVKKGYKIAIISGGNSKGVKQRFDHLGLTDVYLACSNKIEAFNNLVEKYDLNREHILYMGDDLPDWEVMQKVGLPTCPHDAATEIKEIAEYVSPVIGGAGCVRDVIEQTLRVQGKWADKDELGW